MLAKGRRQLDLLPFSSVFLESYFGSPCEFRIINFIIYSCDIKHPLSTFQIVKQLPHHLIGGICGRYVVLSSVRLKDLKVQFTKHKLGKQRN